MNTSNSFNFPLYSQSQQTGEAGIRLVSQVVSNELKWLVRRTHNEHDFGIDGYIDLIDETYVTGRCLAIQVKCGSSYLSHKTEGGYVYYGEAKHLNYYLNHPVPVVLILCNPETEECFWEHFHPLKTEAASRGWKMTIPFNQKLNSSDKKALEYLAGPVEDYTTELEDYWRINNAIAEDFGLISYVVDRLDIEKGDVNNLKELFDRLCVTSTLTKKCQGKVDLSVHGYDEDTRELYEIPEVVAWFKQAEPIIKYWFFFLKSRKDCYGLMTLALCLCNGQKISNKHSAYDNLLFAKFMERNYIWLNEITEDLGLPMETNKRISFEVVKYFGR